MLRVAPLALVATYAYVNPVVAVILGAIVLGEPIDAADRRRGRGHRRRGRPDRHRARADDGSDTRTRTSTAGPIEPVEAGQTSAPAPTT